MRRLFRILSCVSVALSLILGIVYGQTASRPARLITQRINDDQRVTLSGNTRKEATPFNDRGRLSDEYALEHMHLQLKRTPEQEKAVQKVLDDLSNPSSATYHQWMTAAEYGEKLGLAAEDTAEISAWLAAQGFTVHSVSPSRMSIDFSGNAGLVRSAFHTELHKLEVNGENHIANMSDPQVPAALGQAIAGIVGLNNFRPRPLLMQRHNYNVGSGFNTVVPGDLATIYNFNPLFAAGITGVGQTIAVIEDSDMFSTTDWAIFRKTLGLTLKYPKGTFSQVHPGGGTAGPCAVPGSNDDDGEATLDAEWASAAAPNAAIVLASCANTDTNFGAFIALENMLTNGAATPTIMSISYGGSESDNGSGGNAYVNALYQLAVAQGISIFVATGDWGAAVSDAGSPNSTAQFGINVNALASTPNNVAVGGTDFSDFYFGNTPTYWNSTNGANYTSAKSYVPEVPWNDSCGGFVLAEVFGFPTTYGSSGLCNSQFAQGAGLINFAAGSGGPSACALGDANPAMPGIVSGTCAGYPKPSWQSGFAGIQNDGVRDIPDIALFASNGFLGHYYTVCFSDTARGGATCLSTPSTWAGFGGTSVATPIAAGMQALVNQKTGARQGNPVSTYYSLASTEYGARGNSSCNSSRGNGVSASCIFYDVTLGDIDVACTGGINCYMPSGTVGVLSTSNSSYQPAYTTTTGWDFATGIGTINAYNLVMGWPTGLPQ